MKRIISLLLLVGLAFYGAWPAYSGYQIRTALETKDAALLSAKVDFPSVRESMRPAVTAKVETTLSELAKKAGPGGAALVEKLKTQLSPKIVEAALNSLVKPETLIRIHADGRKIKDSMNRIVAEQAAGGFGGPAGAGTGGGTGQGDGSGGGLLDKIGKAVEGFGIDPGKATGGLLGKKDEAEPAGEPKDGTPARKYGLANIKSAGFNGPLGLSLGVAKDAAATEPDVTAEMSFTGTDWKLTGLVPRL